MCRSHIKLAMYSQLIDPELLDRRETQLILLEKGPYKNNTESLLLIFLPRFFKGSFKSDF